MSIEHISDGMIATTDRDADRITFGRLVNGGVSIQLASDEEGLAYVENEDALEVAEFIKASHKAQIECDKCRGKGKVTR